MNRLFILPFLAFGLQPSAFGSGVSTNKAFMLETNNVIPPNATNFFVVNSNLLNASVSGGGGGGGVSSVNGLTGAVSGVLTNGETPAVTLGNSLTLNSNLYGPGWSIVTNGAATATFASYGPNGGYGLYGSAGWTNYEIYPNYITLTGNGLTGNMSASGNMTAAQFFGGGGWLTGLNASALTSGTVPPALLAALPSVNLDRSLGFLVLTNVYHDYQSATNGSITSGGSTLTGGPFTAADVGKEIDFNTGAGQWATTIATYVGPTQVTLAGGTYGSSLNNVFYAWGHDDSEQINATITNALALNVGTILVPSGQYFLNTWIQLARSAGYAQINVVFTNLDLVTNSSRTLALVGMEAPAPQMNWLATAKQPISTNGAIFNCVLNPITANASTIIGCPVEPSNMSWSQVGVNLVLENLTWRTYNNPAFTAIDASYLGQVDFEHLSVDTGTDLSYLAQPTTTTSFGIKFPAVNNWAKSYANDVVVQGYYAGFGIAEHLTAGLLISELNQNGIQFLAGIHGNTIQRFLCQATPTSMYNAGVSNTTSIAEYDVEIDMTQVPAWAEYQYSLYDMGSFQRGGCKFEASADSAAPSAPIAITNSAGCTNFNMVNLRFPLLHPTVNVAQFSTLVSISNALICSNGLYIAWGNLTNVVNANSQVLARDANGAEYNNTAPTISGANITAINASAVASGTLPTNYMQAYFANLYLHSLAGGSPVFTVNYNNVNAVLCAGMPPQCLVWPNSSDNTTFLSLTNGASNTSTNTAGFIIGTNTFAHPRADTNYVVNFAIAPVPGAKNGSVGMGIFGPAYIFSTNQTTTSFLIGITGTGGILAGSAPAVTICYSVSDSQ
jgi:hypothetical protein